MRHSLLVLLCAFVAGCGGDDPATPASGGSGGGTQAPAVDPAEVARKAEEARRAREARAAELRDRKAALEAKIKELDAKFATLDARAEEAIAAVGDIRSLQRRFISRQREMFDATTRYEQMQRELEKLQPLMEKAATGELQTLKTKMAEVEKRYRDALSGWKDSLEETAISRAQPSPVKVKLDALRSIKSKWFEATPSARAGLATANERKAISDGFRAWLDEAPARKAVITEVLAQPGLSQGKSPESFDFTELAFFLMMEMHEDVLDRLNIVVERKELGKNAEKLKTIETELDSLRNQIAEKMSAGGGDLERYEDLSGRIKGQQQKAESLQREVAQLHTIIEEVESVRAQSDRDKDETARAIEDAKRELRKVTADLARAGG